VADTSIVPIPARLGALEQRLASLESVKPNPAVPGTTGGRLAGLDARLTDVESRLAKTVEAPKPRLTWRSSELAELLGLSKSTFHSYVSRGVAPPAITAPGEHVTFYVASTVTDWLKRSEAAGRLLSTREYREMVADDGEAKL
jgi:predicted DNA-binding transcriptional regulator AlpA